MRKILIFLVLFISIFLISSCSLSVVDDSSNDKNEIIELRKEYEELKRRKNELKLQLNELKSSYNSTSILVKELENKLETVEDEIVESYALFDKLENEVLYSSVVISRVCYLESGSGITSTNQYVSGALGSGFIFKKDTNYYYILTNDHVLISDDRANSEYTFVYDAFFNKYEAEVLCRDSAYDMAVLRVDINPEFPTLKSIELANENPKIGDVVISVGQPNGQLNSITIGEVVTYTKNSFVSYQVVMHDAWITNGSSGGMMINTNLEVVGINSWGGSDNTYEEHFGEASPVDKIKEFLLANSLDWEVA